MSLLNLIRSSVPSAYSRTTVDKSIRRKPLPAGVNRSTSLRTSLSLFLTFSGARRAFASHVQKNEALSPAYMLKTVPYAIIVVADVTS